MKPTSILMLLCCLTATSAFAQKPAMSIATPIVVDGHPEEWNTDWLMDTRSKIIYNIANDQDAFYIRLKISDPVNQQKILLYGMTLYFNQEGGKKRGKYGLGYPVGKNSDELKEEQSKDAGNPRTWNDIKTEFVKDAELLELIGLDKHPISTPRIGLMSGLEVIMLVDQFGDLVYETKVPFKTYGLNKSLIKDLGITLETGKMQMKITSGKSGATYYRGMRYAAPPVNVMNPYNMSTIVHLNVTLN